MKGLSTMNIPHPVPAAQRVKEMAHCLIAEDDARASLPYEHAATLAAGVLLAACALRVPHRSWAVAQAALAGALLFRAASGRDGLRRWAGPHGPRPVQSTTTEQDEAASAYGGA